MKKSNESKPKNTLASLRQEEKNKRAKKEASTASSPLKISDILVPTKLEKRLNIHQEERLGIEQKMLFFTVSADCFTAVFMLGIAIYYMIYYRYHLDAGNGMAGFVNDYPYLFSETMIYLLGSTLILTIALPLLFRHSKGAGCR